MLKLTDMLKCSDYRKYHFYGAKKLPAITIHTRYGDFDLSVIDYSKVDTIRGHIDFYDYGHALTQVIYGKAYADIIAVLLDKIGYCSLFYNETDEIGTHLYMYVDFFKGVRQYVKS